MKHLLSLGHVRIAMISGPATLRTSREREIGYLEASKAAGVEPVLVRSDFTIVIASPAYLAANALGWWMA